METLSELWKMAGVRLAEGGPGEPVVLGGCLWLGVKEEAGGEADPTLPLGSSPEQLGLSGKQSQERVG